MSGTRAINKVFKEHKSNQESIISLFVGKRIGRGASRHTYELRMDETRVLKVEHTGFSFNNIAEWKVWEVVRDTPIEDWFAPCYDIDSFGNVMTQARVRVFASDAAFKAAIEDTRGGVLPAFFDDVHFGNFGMLDGRVVCHDYAYNHFLSEAVKYAWRNVVHENVTHSRTHDTQPKVEDQYALL